MVSGYFLERSRFLDSNKGRDESLIFSIQEPHTCHFCFFLCCQFGTTYDVSILLSRAVQAAQSGCALYAWLLDLVLQAGKDEGLGISDAGQQLKITLTRRSKGSRIIKESNRTIYVSNLDQLPRAMLDLRGHHRISGVNWMQSDVGGGGLRGSAEARQFKTESEKKAAEVAFRPYGCRLDLSTESGSGRPIRISKDLECWRQPTRGPPEKDPDIVDPPEWDVASRKSMQYARASMSECLGEHEECKDLELSFVASSPSIIPSRLLEIITTWKNPDLGSSRHSSFVVRLIETTTTTTSNSQSEAQALPISGFSTLSYCWGGPPKLMLSEQTEQQLREGVSIESLPKTLRDAVKVSAEMGVYYIWIDSLCIFQDSPRDKLREIANMPQYYRASRVTICVASAKSSDQGFLYPQERVNYAAGPFGATTTMATTTTAAAAATQVAVFRPPDEWREPLCDRAWTLQEARLSRRLLIFTSRQLYWSCPTTSNGCAGWESQLRKPERYGGCDDANCGCWASITRIMPLGEQLVPGLFPHLLETGVTLDEGWESSIKSFSVRKLAFETDKFLAISAIAAALKPVYDARFGGVHYVAGLWLPADAQLRRTFCRQLLWSSEDPSRAQRTNEYVAPTWSWACLAGPLCLFDRVKENVWYEPPVAEVVGVSVQLVEEKAPFGQVESAGVLLEAPLLEVGTDMLGVVLPPVTCASSTENSTTITEFRSQQPALVFCPDTTDDKRSLEAADSLFLLQIYGFQEDVSSPVGLIVVKTGSSDGRDVCRRVGTFFYHHGSSTKDDQEVADARSYFECGHLQLVELV